MNPQAVSLVAASEHQRQRLPIVWRQEGMFLSVKRRLPVLVVVSLAASRTPPALRSRRRCAVATEDAPIKPLFLIGVPVFLLTLARRPPALRHRPTAAPWQRHDGPPDSAPEAEAAAILRRVLDAVEADELTAETPAERRLVRRVEGAVIGLEAPARP